MTASIAMPDFICDGASSLHVHDALSMASIPGPAPGAAVGRWNRLEWCRVERCPNIDSVFTAPTPLQVAQGRLQTDGNEIGIFWNLRTFWGSQLPKVRCIWNWGTPSSLFQFHRRSFEDLQFLHLDFCPRLIYVLPLPISVMGRCLHNLVTLEIVWCSDLKEIFPVYSGADKRHDESMYMVELWYLKHIHLHELPRLRGICGGSARLAAPNLETIKIRGCWSLRRLPAIISYSQSRKVVECDCEKEWWDNLEWDGLQSDHHPSLYKPTHPRYYKKRMLRGKVLV